MEVQSYLLGKKAGGGSGTTNYNELSNKPSINSTELSGNKTSSDLGLQDTLVSGTNIKTINSTSLLGSGDITISGGGGSKYIINVEGFSGDFNTNTINTAENRAVLQEIYNNFSNVKPSDVMIKDERNQLYNVESVTLFSNVIRIKLTCYYAGNINNYGITYNEYYFYHLYAPVVSGVVGNIEVGSKTSEYDITELFKVLGTSNTTSYTPTGDYNPATKKYVDDSISTAIGTALSGSY